MRHPDGSTRCIVDSLTLVYHQPRKRHTGEYFEMRDGESDMLYRVFLYEGSNRWGYPQNARMHYYPLFTNDGRRIPEKNLVRSKRVGPKEKRALSAGPTKACTRSLLPGQVKRTKKKRKAATNAIREIRKYQGKHFREVERKIDRHGNIETVTKDRYTMEEHATELLIKKAPFQRLVREIAIDFKSDLRMTDKALEALQVAAEAHLLSVFQDANLCALNSLRETVKVRDMRLASKIRRDARPDDLRDWMDKNPGCFVSMSMFKKDGAEDGLYVRKQRREIGCAIPRFDGVPDLYW